MVDTKRALRRMSNRRSWLCRALPIVLLLTIALVVVNQGAAVDWPEVGRAMRRYDRVDIVIGIGLAALTYSIYSGFDLLGRHYIGARIGAGVVMRTAFVSYSINQSIGSLIGAVALRFRLYSNLGLSAVQISQIIVLSVVTNWLGYSVVAGGLFLSGVLRFPGWNEGRFALQLVGAALLCTAALYLVLCARYGDRPIRIRNRRLRVPTIRLALAQLSVSALHWPTAASILYVTLNETIPIPAVLGALLISAMIAALAHIPAGIGVLEGVFVALFSRHMPIDSLLAGLLVFRALYYVAPLSVALAVYLGTEVYPTRKFSRHARRSAATALTADSSRKTA